MIEVVLAIIWWVAAAWAAFMFVATLANLTHSPHWFARGGDFPRVQVAALAVVTAVVAWATDGLTWWTWPIVLAMAFVFVRQAWVILPYTPVWRKQVHAATPGRDRGVLRLVASNVLMENDQYEKWAQVVGQEEPDLILAAEMSQTWIDHTQSLRDRYPHRIERPQDNCYGLALWSRLPLEEVDVRYIVQDDIPSFHCKVRLPKDDPRGAPITIRCLHPRPPEPVRGQHATPRDAELATVGREIEETDEPTIVMGDMNDVAWSHSSRLFMRLSGLLDPRVGRGMFNSYHAQHWYWRFPLDHFFHTCDFELVQLRRLDEVGSDHFPMLIDLAFDPDHAQAEQVEPTTRGNDEQEAQRMIDREEHDEGRRVQSEASHG